MSIKNCKKVPIEFFVCLSFILRTINRILNLSKEINTDLIKKKDSPIMP